MAKANEIPLNRHPATASKSVDETATPQPTDLELVRACQRGEVAPYEQLVGRYRQRVYAHAFNLLRHEQDATDMAQEAFVRAWRAIGRFKNDASFYTWIYRITTNLCIDFVRRRTRQPTTALEEGFDPPPDPNLPQPPSTNPSPSTEAERGELAGQIDRALLELSADHRAVIHLREFEGLDYAEIAKVMNCSMGTVMSRLHYARKHLQKLLRDVL